VPARGLNYLRMTDSNWAAVQVRGKRNERPLPKYLSQITAWFDQNDIPWVEYGARMPGARSDRMITVYNVGGPKGGNYVDMVEAHDAAILDFKEEFEKQGARFNF